MVDEVVEHVGEPNVVVEPAVLLVEGDGCADIDRPVVEDALVAGPRHRGREPADRHVTDAAHARREDALPREVVLRAAGEDLDLPAPLGESVRELTHERLGAADDFRPVARRDDADPTLWLQEPRSLAASSKGARSRGGRRPDITVARRDRRDPTPRRAFGHRPRDGGAPRRARTPARRRHAGSVRRDPRAGGPAVGRAPGRARGAHDPDPGARALHGLAACRTAADRTVDGPGRPRARDELRRPAVARARDRVGARPDLLPLPRAVPARGEPLRRPDPRGHPARRDRPRRERLRRCRGARSLRHQARARAPRVLRDRADGRR